ncbi:response regulator [Salinibius halmophilus]|uniref:response regulator n=1 Tax=Salinibius halmophilus TaxID=1853216 RepID=UPI000E675838|nr:response regulator [Salinibius halmophilus]
MNKTILVVDDDEKILSLLEAYLQRNQFDVLTAIDARSAIATFKQHADTVSLVVLDVMLPDEDGFSVCRQLRQTTSTPIIMLTASADETDRIVGLELGADDYLGKPFNPRELLARIKAILRRTDAPTERSKSDRFYQFEGYQLDTVGRTLTDPNGDVIALSGGEYQLLLYLVERAGAIVDRTQLAEATRGRDPGPLDRYLDVQISRLRARLKDEGRQQRFIKTVRGAGYVFAAEVKRHGGD